MCGAVLALTLCALPASVWAAAVYTARASSITDGDTLWVKPENGGAPRKLRLQGIDAPEICQSGGLAARDALRALVTDQKLTVRVLRQDDYGRALAQIDVDGRDVGAAMVSRGWAWSYRWRQDWGPYVRQEQFARRHKLGIFANAAPELPRDFRRRFGSCHSRQP